MVDKPFPRSSGLTLIELLVVIAVLGMLASVLFVVIDPSRRIAAAINAKQIQYASSIQGALEQLITINQGVLCNNNTGVDDPLACEESVQYVGNNPGSATRSDLSDMLKSNGVLKSIPAPQLTKGGFPCDNTQPDLGFYVETLDLNSDNEYTNYRIYVCMDWTTAQFDNYFDRYQTTGEYADCGSSGSPRLIPGSGPASNQAVLCYMSTNDKPPVAVP
ncbi:type II secretion system protein [candidate division WWE3 bacterium]|uniref:Type II secretion system protein n=1 Tax=candidate division WWE3 bacterium TaxID=2053526 RepID=A0A955LL56_UNCKA|nr:type II secretion system protein [candidate division WWE3 bacterium]